MKNIKVFSKFNESLSKSELKDFDVEDISISLSDWWISVDDALPKENDYVLIYTTARNRNGKVEVAYITFGISKSERKKLKESNPERYKTYTSSDEDGNNHKPYIWHSGPSTYFGQEVLYWMPAPAKPEN